MSFRGVRVRLPLALGTGNHVTPVYGIVHMQLPTGLILDTRAVLQAGVAADT